MAHSKVIMEKKTKKIHKKKTLKVIFMGSSEFSVVIFQGLLKKGYEPVLVVCPPDKPTGRKNIITPPPLKASARRHGILVSQPFRVKEIKEEIARIRPDLIIVAAYGYYIPKEIFEIPKHGTLNVHPSLLPKFRGPSPIQTAIMEGELNAGATIIKIDQEIDHGPIIAKRAVAMPKKVYSKDLEQKLAELGADLLVEILPKWVNKKIKETPQDDTAASFTNIIKKEDGKIDWKNSTAQRIERKVRALHPWPSSYTYWQKPGKEKQMIKIIEAEPIMSAQGKIAGKVRSQKEDKIVVQCKDSSLVVKKLQLEGRIPMTDKEFVLGYEGFIGTVLK